MKKKWTQDGKQYYISSDSGVENLAMKIIEYLKDVKHSSTMTMEDKLWKASYLYLESILNEDKAMVFTRPITLGHHETETQRVEHWFNEAIKAILKTIKNKDKSKTINIVDEKDNGKGLKRYKDADGTFILKGILSPSVMVISSPDYSKLNDMVKSELKMGLNELDCQQFYRLQSDLANNKEETKKLFPTIKSGYLPDDYNNKKELSVDELKLFTQLTLHEKEHTRVSKRIKKMNQTIDVFDVDDVL